MSCIVDWRSSKIASKHQLQDFSWGGPTFKSDKNFDDDTRISFSNKLGVMLNFIYS
jgi:hypothetical protein